MAKVDLDDVLTRAARRDPDALAALVQLYSPRVFGLIYRLSGSAEVAEDLTQETFLRMVRMIERYEHAGRFEAWLFRIAANLARDRARQSVRRGRTMSLDGEAREIDPVASGPGSVTDGPEERLIAKENSARLRVALERLTAPEREILLLRHFSGLSFAEIAEILGVPLGTALARAHRALRRLRAEIGGEA